MNMKAAGPKPLHSFEEYQAINARQRLKTNPSEGGRNSSTSLKPALRKVSFQAGSSSNTSSSSSSSDLPAGRKSSLGAFIERIEVQTLIIILLLLDTSLAFSALIALKEVIPSKTTSSSSSSPLLNLNSAVKIIELLSSFLLGLFLLELTSLLISFHLKFLTHLGYALDTIIIAIQLYALSKGYGFESKVLNVLRLWRLARLFSSSVEKEKRLHEEAVLEVEEIKKNARKAEIEGKRMEIDLQREKESRKAVEEMLQVYKEEVETLNEALKIAAHDIAEAAQDADLLSDDDEEEEEGDEEDEDGAEGGPVKSSTASISSKGNSSLNRYNNDNVSTASSRLSFHIHEDGTFEHK